MFAEGELGHQIVAQVKLYQTSQLVKRIRLDFMHLIRVQVNLLQVPKFVVVKFRLVQSGDVVM